ncbi:transposase zinc-binding domain-containing protein [Sorangium sp. So ce327]|uniref:transposase zinc-binding domain-containing protein n=1 Tax=Sorangium sp. So ce327 TaxID=3133301 RepID=UPI003F5D5F7D
MASAARTTGVVYERRRPEKTTLYEIVRDNVETLYGAIDDGAIAVGIPKHAKKEPEAYLDCGLLCRGFARLRCARCEESRLVAFSCKGRGFCSSCLGRRMCATAANLIEDVLPEVALRQWVLTFPFPWRRRLAQDGALFGVLTRIFVERVERFYEERAARRGACGAVKSGAVTVVQRTSGDMGLNPHLHVVFLDGAYHEDGTELVWNELGHLRTGEIGQVLEHAVGRMLRYLRRHGHLEIEHDVEEDDEPEAALCASAVSGREPPAGPQWLRGLSPSSPSALAYDKPLCAALDGFTLHAATRAGAHHAAAREALLRYVLRPPIAKERVEPQQDCLVRLSLKRAFADGTVAVAMDALSLLCRRRGQRPAAALSHRQARGCARLGKSPTLARKRIGPRPAKPEEPTKADDDAAPKRKRGGYRPWAELLHRTFAIDVLECPACKGRMKLVAMVTESRNIVRFLSALGEPTDVPARSPYREPPYWKSTVLRRKAPGDAA